MSTDVSNNDDVIDSRDVIARIEELESARDDWQAENDLPDYDDPESPENPEWDKWEESEAGQELKILKALAEQCEGYGDWQYGETLIRDSYFEDYAQELANDLGYIDNDKSSQWPYTCIDWTEAAEELQQDYTQVDFNGVDYWMRA